MCTVYMDTHMAADETVHPFLRTHFSIRRSLCVCLPVLMIHHHRKLSIIIAISVSFCFLSLYTLSISFIHFSLFQTMMRTLKITANIFPFEQCAETRRRKRKTAQFNPLCNKEKRFIFHQQHIYTVLTSFCIDFSFHCFLLLLLQKVKNATNLYRFFTSSLN